QLGPKRELPWNPPLFLRQFCYRAPHFYLGDFQSCDGGGRRDLLAGFRTQLYCVLLWPRLTWRHDGGDDARGRSDLLCGLRTQLYYALRLPPRRAAGGHVGGGGRRRRHREPALVEANSTRVGAEDDRLAPRI